MRDTDRVARGKAVEREEPVSRRDDDAQRRWSRDELLAAGKTLRERTPRRGQAVWKRPVRRPDPIELLIQSSRGRLKPLVPIRYGRMLQSPFTFYRGAAAVMASDLSHTPASGIQVQACGDCHLLNFGGFATPERRVIFDINDFDETHPAPWEWDVKRLAASFTLAGRNNKLAERVCRDAAQESARSYREHTAEYAQMLVLRQWYSSLDWEELMSGTSDRELRKLRLKRLEKAASHSSAEIDYPKLVEHVGGRPTIKDNPPLVYHADEQKEPGFKDNARLAIARYFESLSADKRVLLGRYRFTDFAVKVVGIGSVGTFCGIALLLADDDDPLFLQVKEARASVLEAYAGESRFSTHGERVVVGQRIMQAASDVFLGWTHGEKGRHFYIRQLRDVKLKPMVEVFNGENLREFAGFCGWALARAHARSGYAALISGYLGGNPVFDEAMAEFGAHYADQTEQDHEALIKAVRGGRIEAMPEA